jgi:pimeloyl-ACP methyl ester carboxylesterase
MYNPNVINFNITNSNDSSHNYISIEEIKEKNSLRFGEDTFKVTREFNISINPSFYENNYLNIEIECDSNEIAVAINRDFFEYTFKKNKNSYKQTRLCPLYLFESKTELESDSKLCFLSSILNKSRILSWYEEQKEYMKNKKNELINLKVFVFKVLKLKNEISTPSLNSIIENNGILNLVVPNKEKILDSDKDIVLLVHGLGSVIGENFKGLYSEVNTLYHVLGFSYPTVKNSIEDNSLALHNLLQDYKDKNIHVFSHSMGGLISRYALRKYKSPITNLIMAGTPNNGAKAAIFAKLSNISSYTLSFSIYKKLFKDAYFFIAFMECFKLGFWNVADLLAFKNTETPGIDQLMYQSSFIRELNKIEEENRSWKNYYVLAGNSKRFFNKTHDKIVETDNISRIKTDNEEIQLFGTIKPWNHDEYYSKDKINLLKQVIPDINRFLELDKRKPLISV